MHAPFAFTSVEAFGCRQTTVLCLQSSRQLALYQKKDLSAQKAGHLYKEWTANWSIHRASAAPQDDGPCG
jgi:hypothetical protein